jgi:hypothetical protein
MPYGNLLADVVQGSTANTPPVFKDGNGTTIGTLCRAWVNFNGTGTVAIRASFNVSSITDNGTGDYTVNFTNAMPDANYVNCVGAVVNGSAVNLPYNPLSAKTTTSLRLIAYQLVASAADVNEVNVAIFR